MKIDVRVELDIGKLNSKAKNAKKSAQMQLDQDVLKDSNYFIPKDDGILEGSALSASLIGKGKIIWNTPYARRLYYNPQYNFSKDKNPNAQGLWFEVAKTKNGIGWISDLKREYGKYFNGR